jgi:hypothetical protein
MQARSSKVALFALLEFLYVLIGTIQSTAFSLTTGIYAKGALLHCYSMRTLPFTNQCLLGEEGHAITGFNQCPLG